MWLVGAQANWQGGVQANGAIQTNLKWKERSMLLYSGKFTGGYHESDLSQTHNFPFYVLFSEYLVVYILTIMNQSFF